MTTFVEAIQPLTSGTTASTFGTVVAMTLNSVARRGLGLVVAGCDTVFTTAEGSATILKVDSPSLQLSDQRFEVGPYTTSGPATNSSGQSMIAEVTPINWLCQGNEIINFSSAVSATNTTAKKHNVCLIYSDAVNPPTDWMLDFPFIATARGGYVSVASQTTTTRTALTAINVPTWVQEFIGAKSSVLKTGAVTTAEYELGIFDLTSSIPNIAPMKLTTNAIGSTLGTPVGTGIYHDEIRAIPIWFSNVGGSQTITPNITLNNAVTTANNVQFGIYWR